MICTECNRNLFNVQPCYGTGGGDRGKGASRSLRSAGGNIMDNMRRNGAAMKFKDSLIGKAWNSPAVQNLGGGTPDHGRYNAMGDYG